MDSIELATAKNWVLPSGQHVDEIFNKNISQLAKSTKAKEKFDAIERATLRYCVSRIIDLSAHMRDWFSVDEFESMKEDYKTILKIPDLEEEVNVFITEVEKVINVYRYISLHICIIYTFSFYA